MFCATKRQIITFQGNFSTYNVAVIVLFFHFDKGIPEKIVHKIRINFPILLTDKIINIEPSQNFDGICVIEF